MKWKCLLFGCKWRMIGLHIGDEILVNHRCERCQAERWRVAP